MRHTRHLVCLAAVSVFPGACKEHKGANPAAEPSQGIGAKPEAEREPTIATAKVKAAYALAGPLCTKLTRHQLFLATKPGEVLDESWDEAITLMLAVCMTTNYSPEEVRCMSTAVTSEGYESCTEERRAQAKTVEARSRNPHAIPWLADLDAGLAQAEKDDKPLLVHVVAQWCLPCKVFETEVCGVPEVAAVMTERFVNVRLDVSESTDGDLALQDRLNAATLPALIVFNQKGEEIARQNYGVPPTPESFIAFLHSITDGREK